MIKFFFNKTKDNHDQKKALMVAIGCESNKGKDFEVVIREPEKERSPKALRGYWRLIGVITKHLNSDGDYIWDGDEVSDMFKENSGFIYVRDLMSFWKRRYKKELREGYELYHWMDDGSYTLQQINAAEKEDGFSDMIPLGNRHRAIPKSLARKAGCTIEDIKKLIGEVLRFGSDIPGCVLRSDEEREMNKYYGVK